MRAFSATLITFLALAAPALANDPLLSGYSGPGGLDQSLLGGGLVGGGGSGSGGNSSGSTRGGGSLRAPAPAVAQPAPGTEGTVADVSAVPRLSRTPTAVAATSSGTQARPGSKRTLSGAAGAGAPSSSSSKASPGGASVGVRAGAQTSAADGGSAFPVSATDLLLLLLGAVALLGIARATARLGGSAVPGT